MTRQELSKKYQCDHRTLNEQLRKLGITHSKKLFPLELELIRTKVGDWDK